MAVAAPPASKPAGAAPTPPAPPVAASPAHPGHSTAGQGGFTFQVGSFAHQENAKELSGKLESKGFTTRVEQGQSKTRPFYTVYATKQGSRAALEGELFAVGVTEPVLAAEHPDGGPAAAKPQTPSASPPPPTKAAVKGQTSAKDRTRPAEAPTVQGKTGPKASVPEKTGAKAGKKSPGVPKAATKTPAKAPAKATAKPVKQSAPKTAQTLPPAITPTPVPTVPRAEPAVPAGKVRYAPPKVEPAPPLPDGYVPPPPKASGS
ncbi:MAG: SPOR domain-containing protein [Desulfovibrionaceae bacterium]